MCVCVRVCERERKSFELFIVPMACALRKVEELLSRKGSFAREALPILPLIPTLVYCLHDKVDSVLPLPRDR